MSLLPRQDTQSVGLQHSYLPGSSTEVCAPQCAGKVAAATETPVTQSGNRLTTFPSINANVPLSHPEHDVGQSRGAVSQALPWRVPALFGAESCLQLAQLHLLIRSEEPAASQRDANHCILPATSQGIWCVLATSAPRPIGTPFYEI